jgi:FkbM family methyltransferase
MLITKDNILTYLRIILEAQNKRDIFSYIFKRFRGIKTKVDHDVIIKNNGILLNSGRIMENATVACSQFEKGIARELDIKEGTFIDVGAHIGKHSITIAKRLGSRGKVLSIEANKDTVKLLRYNVNANKLNNVTVYEAICSDKSGKEIFYSNEFHPALNSISPINNAKKDIIKAITLDEIAGDLKDIKLIKIDVEGAEDKVLIGAKKILKLNHPKIIFEAWKEDKLKIIINILKKYNYKIKRLDSENYLAI